MTEIRYAYLARRDLLDISRHYDAIDPRLGLTMLNRIVDAVDLLQDNPFAGPIHRGLRRKWRVRQTPYLIFYRAERDHLRILRIVHGARRIAAA